MKLDGQTMMVVIGAWLLWHGVMFCIAIFEYAREHKKFIDLGSWFMNFLLSLSMTTKAAYGKIVPRFRIVVADNKYWLPTTELVVSLTPKVHELMIERGYDAGGYIPDRQDCDDYAESRCTALHDLLRDASKNIQEAQKKGIPTFRFSFTTSKGGRHRIAGVKTVEGDVYFEMMPTKENETPRVMDKKELASGYKII